MHPRCNGGGLSHPGRLSTVVCTSQAFNVNVDGNGNAASTLLNFLRTLDKPTYLFVDRCVLSIVATHSFVHSLPCDLRSRTCTLEIRSLLNSIKLASGFLRVIVTVQDPSLFYQDPVLSSEMYHVQLKGLTPPEVEELLALHMPLLPLSQRKQVAAVSATCHLCYPGELLSLREYAML